MSRNDLIAQRQVQAAERLIAVLEKAWGPHHIKVLSPLKNLGDLYFALGQYIECEQICWKLLSVAIKNYGPEHPVVASALQMIGEVHEVQGLHAESERFYLWALSVRQKSQSETETAEILARLAAFYRCSKEPFKSHVIEMRLARVLTHARKTRSRAM